MRWRRLTTREWMAGAFLIAVAIFVMSRTLTSVAGTDLRATARWSFLLFFLGTTGGALARLFGPMFDGLARRGRDLSLAYASAHLVHLAIVVRLIYKGDPIGTSTLLFFGAAVFWTYLLAILSIKSLRARLKPAIWRVVRIVGVEYIALAFFIDFNKNPFHGGFFKALDYLPFIVLSVAGPLLRLAAFVKRIGTERKTQAKFHDLVD
jgi:hypothetical protein